MDFFDSVFAPQDHQRRERTVQGIAVAKVTGRMDDGTYELQFLSMGRDTRSAPARMMMPNAGNQRGMYWMPEVDDEVVVAFEFGDTNMPIILGALYNGQSPAPSQAQPSNDNNVRTLVSRSGHEITLDDSPSAGKVTVKTKDGRSLTLDDTPPGKVSMQTPSGISIELDDAQGKLSLKAPTEIVLETASLQLNVGGLAVLPGATLGTGTMVVMVPTAVVIQSTEITLTSAPTPAGAVVINGKPM